MTTQLKCAECNEMFEVSTETAEAMHRWREPSGEAFLCGECAGVDEIVSAETDTEPRTVHNEQSIRINPTHSHGRRK